MQTEFKEKRIKTPDGTTMILFNGKLHSWDGPALIPQGNEKLAEYYINGIKMDFKQWKKALRGREGAPYYKSGSAKARF